MVNHRFRIYCGPQDDTTSTMLDNVEAPTRSQVTVPAGEVFQILTDAIEGNRAWLNDFANDEITISTDLYEVMLAYQHIRRPSA